MVFHWSLCDSKSPQVSKTLLSILVVLNNAVVWMFSIRPLTSKPSSPFNNPLVTVPKAPITVGIIVTFRFHSFFNSLARSSIFLSFHILSVLFCGQPGQQSPLLLLWLFTPLEFFTSVLADGFSLEFEWQQVFSSLQDSSQYSGHPQQCCRLDSLYPSAKLLMSTSLQR